MQGPVAEVIGIDERHPPTLAAHDVRIRSSRARSEELELVLVATGRTAEAAYAEGLELRQIDDQPGLLLQLADGSGPEVLTGLEVTAGVSPASGVVERLVAALLQEQAASGVDQGDGREPVHPPTLATSHIRTR